MTITLGNNRVTLNYKNAGYETSEEVPFWRVYIYKVTNRKVPVKVLKDREFVDAIDRRTGKPILRREQSTELLVRTEQAYTMNDLFCIFNGVEKYPKNYRIYAFARKRRDARVR